MSRKSSAKQLSENLPKSGGIFDERNSRSRPKVSSSEKKKSSRNSKISDNEYPQFLSKSLSVKEIRMNTLKKFYTNKQNRKTFVSIVTGTHELKKLSLRIFDWFVTNYSKKYNVLYRIYPNEPLFDVYNDYRAQLKAFTKKGFDPFCRGKQDDIIEYIYKHHDRTRKIQTTIAQMNFFKWAITNRVIDYVINNFDVIFKDMNEANKKQRLESEKHKRALHSSDDKTVSKYYTKNSSSKSSSIKKQENRKVSKKPSQKLIGRTSSLDSATDNDSTSDDELLEDPYSQTSDSDTDQDLSHLSQSIESSDKENILNLPIDIKLSKPPNQMNILEFAKTKKDKNKMARKTKRKPRQELSESNAKNLHKYSSPIKIEFI